MKLKIKLVFGLAMLAGLLGFKSMQIRMEALSTGQQLHAGTDGNGGKGASGGINGRRPPTEESDA